MNYTERYTDAAVRGENIHLMESRKPALSLSKGTIAAPFYKLMAGVIKIMLTSSDSALNYHFREWWNTLIKWGLSWLPLTTGSSSLILE